MSYITVTANDQSGNFKAYVAKPSLENAPVILVIQEIFGINKVMRDICDDLASKGYIAVCPDLFWRQEPGIDITDQTEEEWAKAFELFNGFDVDKGVEDLIATLNLCRTLDRSNGKVGSIGYCLGGKLAYLMATRSNADCNVSYYGVGLDELLDEKENIQNPLLMHMAELDQFVPAEAQTKIKNALKDMDIIDLYSYADVDHAFARMGGEHYNEKAANAANERTAAFLEKHLK